MDAKRGSETVLSIDMLTQQLITWPSWRSAGGLKMKMGWINPDQKGRLKLLLPLLSNPSPLTYNEAFSSQLRKQQQQFDTLMSKVQAMVTTLQSDNSQAASTYSKGGPFNLDEG